MSHFCMKRNLAVSEQMDTEPQWVEMQGLSALSWPWQKVGGALPVDLAIQEYRRRLALDECPAADTCSQAACYYKTGILINRKGQGVIGAFGHHLVGQRRGKEETGLDGLVALVTLSRGDQPTKEKKANPPLAVQGKLL